MHTTAVPLHAPDWQVVLERHLLLDVHAVPLATFVSTQAPLDGSQAADWQGLVLVHTTGVPPLHVPFWHVVPGRHALPVEQAVPLVTLAKPHPVDGLHAATWHWFVDAGQVTGAPPPHAPAPLHVVPVRHALPLGQGVPEATGVPGGQLAAVPVQLAALVHEVAAAHCVPAVT